MSKCVYCGNNPTPHLLCWFNETVTVIMTPINQLIFGKKFGKFIFKTTGIIFSPLVRMLEKVGMITYSSEMSKATSSRAKVLWTEAKQRGLQMESVRIFGRENDSYRVMIGDQMIHFSGLPRPEYMPHTAEWWMDDKALVKEILHKAGIPVPAGQAFSRFRPLKKMFEKLTKPVIIKPRLGSRGRHTTTFIYTEEQLKKAFKIAKELCYWVVMEEHLVGSVYRGTMIDGKLAGVLRGDPPRVTGDGIHTVRELIEIKNQNKHPEIHNVKITPSMEVFLARTGRTPDDVLSVDEIIDLSEKIGVSYGGNSAEDTHRTHSETKRILEAAAAAIGDPLIGFDFIIEDIDQSPHEQKWGIIECNGVPFINLHHDPIEGPSNNVAKYVWDFVEKNVTYY